MVKEQAAAILTIKDAAEMTEKGKMNVVRWLRRQAYFLEKYNTELGPRYTARYLYE